MKEYIKPYIDEEEIELEDVIAASGTRGVEEFDDTDPFGSLK